MFELWDKDGQDKLEKCSQCKLLVPEDLIWGGVCEHCRSHAD